jgi:integrase/recombinase XerD
MQDQPICSLRQRMLEAMAVRNLAEKTRHDYIRHVKSFASFLGRSPETASADDLRRFQLHQRLAGSQRPASNTTSRSRRSPTWSSPIPTRSPCASHTAAPN